MKPQIIYQYPVRRRGKNLGPAGVFQGSLANLFCITPGTNLIAGKLRHIHHKVGPQVKKDPLTIPLLHHLKL